MDTIETRKGDAAAAMAFAHTRVPLETMMDKRFLAWQTPISPIPASSTGRIAARLRRAASTPSSTMAETQARGEFEAEGESLGLPDSLSGG